MFESKKSAFITVNCKCPICSRESTHRYVKSKLFTPQEVEADQHVLTYKWESPRFEGIRPSFYHIWACPACHFSDEKEVFRGKDDSGGKLELIREKVLIASKAPYSFTNRMGNAFNLQQEFVTLESSLCAHLLAIYIQEMLSPNMRQCRKLGRLYLRTAWLYREKACSRLPETDVPRGFPSLQDFLISLREEWVELPLGEEAAIRKSIFYYQADLDRSQRVDDIRHEIGVLFLLEDLHMRLGDRENALRIVRDIFQTATRKRQGTRQALDAAVSRGKGTGQQMETLRSLITWLNNAIERANDINERINDMIFEEEYPEARELVLQMSEPTVKAILGLLRNDGFHDITCRRVAAIFSKKMLERQINALEEPEEPVPAEKEDKGFMQVLLKRLTGWVKS